MSFLDDAPILWRRTINGIPIQPPRSERRRIVFELQRQAIPVLQIPSVDDLTSGQSRIDSLRPVAIEDLLGRDPVPPVPELIG